MTHERETKVAEGDEPIVEPGLRERKRRATSRSIQFAVLELSRDKGLDNVTVDEISRRADISPRTFFNYFPSKEAAVLGEAPFGLTPELSKAFIAAGPDAPVFDGLKAIMHKLAAADSEDLEIHHLRRLVIRDYPHLLVQRISTLRDFEVELSDMVAERLVMDAATLAARSPAASPIEQPDPTRLAERGRLISLVAIAAMRHAWGCWAESPDSGSMSTQVDKSFTDLQTLL